MLICQPRGTYTCTYSQGCCILIREHPICICRGGNTFHVRKFPPLESFRKRSPPPFSQKRHIKWSNSPKKWIKWPKKFTSINCSRKKSPPLNYSEKSPPREKCSPQRHINIGCSLRKIWYFYLSLPFVACIQNTRSHREMSAKRVI